jgi:hypothetical protein
MDPVAALELDRSAAAGWRWREACERLTDDTVAAVRTAGWLALELIEADDLALSLNWIARGQRLIDRFGDTEAAGGRVALVPAEGEYAGAQSSAYGLQPPICIILPSRAAGQMGGSVEAIDWRPRLPLWLWTSRSSPARSRPWSSR